MRFCVVQVMELGGTFVRSSGRFNARDMKTLIESLSTMESSGDAQILHDMRLVDFDVRVEEVIETGRAAPESLEIRKLALVSGSALGFGMLRVIASIRENFNRTVKAFRTIPEALDWLDLPLAGLTIPEAVDLIFDEQIRCNGDDPDGFGMVIQKLGGDGSVI